jgi:spermidine synthase
MEPRPQIFRKIHGSFFFFAFPAMHLLPPYVVMTKLKLFIYTILILCRHLHSRIQVSESGREMNLKDLRSSFFLISIYAAFLASGASSLFAEVTWKHMLIVVVGNSMGAVAMIIVVFMGGLGLGSYVGGKVLGDRRSSLLPYLLLETSIGVYILLSPSLFRLLSHIFSILAESVAHRPSLSLIRMVVSLGALFLPASLMGATFPAMIAGSAPDSPSKRTARTGFLYGINTLGAAVGCYVAGYQLLYEVGVQTTLVCAFGLNVFAALCALVANILRTPAPAEPVAIPARPVSDPAPDDGLRRFLNIATFLIGFVALAYEVLLTRLGILYMGNITSVFALVLTAFLLGTGISAVLGTWCYGILLRHTQHSNKLFGVVTLLAAAVIISTPYFLLTGAGGLIAKQLAIASGQASQGSLTVLGLMVAPTILIGALLPIAIRMLRPEERGEATREAATLYALNTAGGLLGAALINHFFVPFIGLEGVLILLTSLGAAVGIFSLLRSLKNPLRWSAAALFVVSVTVVLAVTLPNIKALYAAKVAKSTGAPSVDVRLIREGRAANVAVLDTTYPGIVTYRDMLLNGIEEASTRYWHTQLFKLLGALPVMVHESEKPKDVLVIAFGAGITAGSVLASDDVASLDVVDLNPDIEGINDLFTSVNGDVFHNPRFHFHNDDGRNYLVTSGKRYDLIICDSTHPRAYDSWILYTQEFYRSVKRRLAPGGIFAQWVPVDPSMRGSLFRIHLNTFHSVFPHATLWYVYGSDQAFLLATPGPLTINAQRLQQKLDRLPGWFQAHYYQIDTVARLAGFFWLDEGALLQMIGSETRINTDDLNYFDKQSAVRPLPPQWQLQRYQTSILPYLEQKDDDLSAAIQKEQAVAQLVSRYRFLSNPRDLLAAYCFDPVNGDVRYWMSMEAGTSSLDYTGLCRDFFNAATHEETMHDASQIPAGQGSQ